MELVPIFQYKPVPPITYWWIWMPLQEVNIYIGTQIRSGSTMINTHWHAKIDAQQLFYFMILSVERILNDLAVSIKGTLQRYPHNFYICQVRRMLSQEPWKYPSYRGGVHWLKYQSVHSCYSFAGKWSRKTRINESFQSLYPVTARLKKLLQKARVTAPAWHQEVHITILVFVLKAASEEHNVIRVLCGDLDCRLPARVRVQN